MSIRRPDYVRWKELILRLDQLEDEQAVREVWRLITEMRGREPIEKREGEERILETEAPKVEAKELRLSDVVKEPVDFDGVLTVTPHGAPCTRSASPSYRGTN